MAIIHLLKNYNNYYNRQLKIRENLDDYLDDEDIYITSIGSEERPANFDIKDGLLTEAIFNYSILMPTPDYCLVEIDNTFTRWFVIECKQTRGLQHRAILKRDVIAEYYDVIKESPCLIQKGYVNNNSILSFNKENQSYNKIKDKEILLKDNTQSGYVVGFIDRGAENNNTITATYSDGLSVNFDYSTLPSSIKDYMAIGSATPTSTNKRILNDDKKNILVSANFGLDFGNDDSSLISIPDGQWNYGKVYASENSSGRSAFSNAPSTGDIVSNTATLTTQIYYQNDPITYTNCYAYTYKSGLPTNTEITNFMSAFSSIWKNKLAVFDLSYWSSMLSLNYNKTLDLLEYNGQICEIGGVYYKCEIASINSQNNSLVASSSTLANWITSSIRGKMPTSQELGGITAGNTSPRYGNGHDPDYIQPSDITIYYKTEDIYIKLVQQNVKVWTKLTAKASRNHLIDAPYDMFVIPYSEIQYKYMNQTFTANKSMALNIAIEICRSLGTGASYDIQIVPYCPIRNEGTMADPVDFSLCNCELIYNGSTLDPNQDDAIGLYMWAEKSSENFYINENNADLTLVSSELTYKEITQLKQFILCSPDKASQWEFNPCMNNGIKRWNISFDYRPFSSYVRIQPEWSYLYGTDGPDIRGLIFNGAYSITQLSDAWSNYVANNKNYQAIFDTQINTQIKQYDVQNKASWETLIPRSIGWGFIGPAMKTYYNIKEQEMTEQLQNISLESQRKLFSYQLDNIQNQPTTISKLTSINMDFRIFPFVEIFKGSDDDLKNFRNNIKWNGMTIMCVGKIEEYIESNNETFIQATLLRYNHFINIENDFTAVQEINAELNKGVYITKEV